MSDNRLFFLDRLRFFVIFLVICLHAAMTYMVHVPGWWYVIDPERRVIFTLVVLGLDAFVMPTMFFLAGYFALPSMLKRSTGEFLSGKFRRIGIPWLLGWMLIAPVLAYRSWLSLKLPTKGFLHFVKTDFWGPIYQQGPYWFLGILLGFFVLLAVARPLLGRGETGMATGNSKRPGIMLFLTFWGTTGAVFFLANLHWPLDTWIHPGYLFVFQPLRLIPYFLNFCLGILAWRQRWFLEGHYSPRPLFWIPPAFASGALFLGLKVTADVQSTLLLKLANSLLHNAFSLTAMMGLLGVFALSRSACDPVGAYLGREAYGVYWVHMPVIMVLAALLVPVPLSPYLKFLVLVGSGTFLCVTSARYLRKVAFLGRHF